MAALPQARQKEGRVGGKACAHPMTSPSICDMAPMRTSHSCVPASCDAILSTTWWSSFSLVTLISTALTRPSCPKVAASARGTSFDCAPRAFPDSVRENTSFQGGGEEARNIAFKREVSQEFAECEMRGGSWRAWASASCAAGAVRRVPPRAPLGGLMVGCEVPGGPSAALPAWGIGNLMHIHRHTQLWKQRWLQADESASYI